MYKKKDFFLMTMNCHNFPIEFVRRHYFISNHFVT